MRMWQFEPTRHHPLYEQIKNDLRSRISSGELAAGDRLPAEADLADKLGVSLITISRALTDLAKEGLICRRRRLGTFVSEKASRKTPIIRGTIGLSVPDLSASFVPEVAKGISDICVDRGYLLQIHNTYEDTGREEQALQKMYADKVNGIILFASAATTRDNFIASLDNKFPTIIVDSWIKGLHADFVCTADRKGARHAVEHLIRLGHNRILHLTGKGEISTDRERKRGYLDALRDANIELDPDLIVTTTGDHLQDYPLLRGLLVKGLKFSAVFAVNDFVAVSFIQAALDAGYKVPHQIAVVGYADILEFRRFKIPLTTVHQPANEMGRSAMHLLIERIEEGNSVRRRPRRILLPTELIIRESCGAWLKPPREMS